VLRSAAEEVGLDPDEMEESTVSGRYKPVVDAITQKAKSMGITAVPAYILGRKYAILGA
jgi:predicted DsbA family dithiol-disulfide isomerase